MKATSPKPASRPSSAAPDRVAGVLCFKLWDRTPHAWKKIEQWSTRRGEFQKRASFALLACVALHDKAAPDAPFIKSLSLLEREATDDRGRP